MFRAAPRKVASGAKASTRVSSGNSKIVVAIDLDHGGAEVVLKLMRDRDEFEREKAFYRYLYTRPGAQDFVVEMKECIDEGHTDANGEALSVLVLEYGAGGNLADLHSDPSRSGGTDQTEKMKGMLQASKCVKFLHQNGVVWGDLKPENFVVCGRIDGPSLRCQTTNPSMRCSLLSLKSRRRRKRRRKAVTRVTKAVAVAGAQ